MIELTPNPHPNPRLQQINQELLRAGAVEELTKIAKRGNPQAQHVLDTYKIHYHRRDPISEQFIIAAWNDHTRNTEDPNHQPTPTVLEWIESELLHYHTTGHAAVNPVTSFQPWRYIPTIGEDSPDNQTVWGAAGPPTHRVAQIAAIEYDSPEAAHEQDIERAHGTLIQNAAPFALQLDHSQLAMLDIMNHISVGALLSLPRLEAEVRVLDDLINPLASEFELATPGPWRYSPEDFTIYAGTNRQPIPIAHLGSTKRDYSANQLRHIHADADLITALPDLAHQLQHSRYALNRTVRGLEAGKSLQVFNELHQVAVENDAALRAARGDSLNPHTQLPLPGTPGYERWIQANLEIVSASSAVRRRVPMEANTYLQPEQQSGIYQGKIEAVSKEFYLQHRSDDSLVAHWKGSFREPLIVGQSCVISYRQQKATAREITQQSQLNTAIER